MPMTVMRTSGRVRHIRPLPSDSTTTTVPRLGDGEVGAGDGDARAQELLAQVEPGRLGELRRVVGQVGRRRPAGAAISPMKMSRISVRLRWIAGTRMCDGRSCPSWTIISARSVSQTSMPSQAERLVELDLLGRHRLDLDDLGRAVRPGRSPATIAFASAASRAQWTVPPAAVTARLELLEQRRQVAQDLVLDRGAGEPQRLPVGALGDGRGALGPDRRRRPAEVRPGAARRRARRGPPPGTAACRAKVGSGRSRPGGSGAVRPCRSRRPSVAARISARCMTRTGDRCRDSSPPMCIRHDVSPAVRTSAPEPSDVVDLVEAHRDRGVGVLDRERAAEPAARVGRAAGRPASGRRPRRGAASAGRRRRAAASSGRSGGTRPCAGTRADVGHAERRRPGTRSARRTRGATAATRAGSAGVAAPAASSATSGWWWRTIAAHEPDGVTTTS